jgi:hypothetical protein
MKRLIAFTIGILAALVFCLILLSFGTGCTSSPPKSDAVEAQRQEVASQEAAAAVSAPAITNFWEKRQLKTIYELRDNPKPTYCYIFSQFTGKFTYLGITIGYGIPYATQFNNPEKYMHTWDAVITLPQAEPNALFSPTSAAGTWILFEDASGKLQPQYVEENISVFTEKLPANIVMNP